MAYWVLQTLCNHASLLKTNDRILNTLISTGTYIRIYHLFNQAGKNIDQTTKTQINIYIT